MAQTKADQRLTVVANIPGLLRELEQLGQKARPAEREQSATPAAMIIKGK